MTHRYTGTVGKKFSGENIPRAHEVQGTARLLVQQCINQIDYNGGWGQACRQLALRDGTIVKAIVLKHIRGFEPIVRFEVFAPQSLRQEVARSEFWFITMAWQPEGIFITPRTLEAPYGYAAPRRDYITGERINPPFGTPVTEEFDDSIYPLRHVLINKFENNRYLDTPEMFSSVLPDITLPNNARLRESIEGAPNRPPTYANWPLGFTPPHLKTLSRDYWLEWENAIRWPDEPGINVWASDLSVFAPFRLGSVEPGTALPFRQFDPDGYIQIDEPESDQWYCHWPEELLYESDMEETVYQLTNLVRSIFGRGPVIRPIRGCPDTALRVAIEMQIGQGMHHYGLDEDREAQTGEDIYRPGYETPEARKELCNLRSHGENLQVSSIGGADDGAGDQYVAAWVGSSGHFANMVSAGWSDFPTASLFISPALPATIKSDGTPNKNTYDPPIHGYAMSQVFAHSTYGPGAAYLFETDYGRIGLRSVSSGLVRFDSSVEYPHHIFWGAKHLVCTPVFQYNRDQTEQALGGLEFLIGAALVKSENGYIQPRVVAVRKSDEGTRLMIYEKTGPGIDDHDVGDFTFVHDLPMGWNTISDALLSELVGVTLVSQDVEIATVPSFTTDGQGFRLYIDVHVVSNQGLLFSRVGVEGVVSRFDRYEVVFDGALSATRLEYPKFTHELETVVVNPVDDVKRAEVYTRSFHGMVDVAPTYIGGEPDSVRLQVDFDCIQSASSAAVVDEVQTLVFPSGRQIEVVRQSLRENAIQGACFYSAILYMNTQTEDVVLARADLRMVGTSCLAVVSIVVNGETMYRYPERIIASNYLEGDATRLSGYWAGNGDSASMLYGMIDLFLLRRFDASSNLYPIAALNNLSNAAGTVWKCVGRTDIGRVAKRPLVGELDVFVRNDFDVNCASGDADGERYIVGDRPFGPMLVYDLGFDAPASAARCNFVRYKDRWVAVVKFGRFANVPALDEEKGYDVHIFASFDYATEVGLGPLTDIDPIGVI